MQKVSCSIFRTFRSRFEPNKPSNDCRHYSVFLDSFFQILKHKKPRFFTRLKNSAFFPTALQFIVIAKDCNLPKTLSLSYNIGNLCFLLELLEQIIQGFSIFQTLGRIFHKLQEENSSAREILQ